MSEISLALDRLLFDCSGMQVWRKIGQKNQQKTIIFCHPLVWHQAKNRVVAAKLLAEVNSRLEETEIETAVDGNSSTCSA